MDVGRFVKVYPLMDAQASSLSQIRRYLKSEKYESRGRDGAYVFARKATRFMKLNYMDEMVRLEAWVECADPAAEEQALMQQVEQIEKILLCENEREEPVQEIPADEKLTKQLYLRKYAGEEFNANLKLLGILGYVMLIPIVISALSNPVVLLDGAILLGLTLGMHLGRSKACAIGIAGYSAVNCLLSLGSAGMLTGWGWVILGVFAFMQFQKAEKQYKELLRDRKAASE